MSNTSSVLIANGTKMPVSGFAPLSDGAQEGVYLKCLIQEITQTRLDFTSVKCTDKQLLQDLKASQIPTQQDMHFLSNNISAIKLAKNPVSTQGSTI